MKISVIIPVYNVEKYLNRCIESICMQSFTNLEIILVDDGSPDRCPIICDEWAKRDERIRVIHKQNGGLSDARNAGIEAATGDYFLFVDSDDYIASSMCESLINAARSSNADIVVCNFCWVYPNREEINPMSIQNGTIVEREAILETWLKCGTVDFVVAWNKLYRRSLFFTQEHIRYPVGRLHEDEFITYRLLYAANRVMFITEPLYFYIQRNGSIMANYTEKNLFDYTAAIREYVKWAERFAPDKRKLMEYITMRAVWAIVHKCDENHQLKNKQEVCQFLRDYVNKEIKDFRHNPYATGRDYVKFVMYKMGIYALVSKFWQRLRKR